MIQILIGYIFLLFDPMPKVLYFDLLPDYFGYAFIIWGFWKIRKVMIANEIDGEYAKYGMISAVVLFIYSYIICVVGMYGKLDNISTASSVALNIASDTGEIAFAYFIINTLKRLQDKNKYFQVKRMMFLVEVIAFVDICMYISVKKPLTYGTFLVFKLIGSIILMAYFLVSVLTYREKYIKKKSKKNVSGNNKKSSIASNANSIKKSNTNNNFRNIVNTKKIKK